MQRSIFYAQKCWTDGKTKKYMHGHTWITGLYWCSFSLPACFFFYCRKCRSFRWHTRHYVGNITCGRLLCRFIHRCKTAGQKRIFNGYRLRRCRIFSRADMRNYFCQKLFGRRIFYEAVNNTVMFGHRWYNWCKFPSQISLKWLLKFVIWCVIMIEIIYFGGFSYEAYQNHQSG